jgi:hypothetical protein
MEMLLKKREKGLQETHFEICVVQFGNALPYLLLPGVYLVLRMDFVAL